MPDQPSAMHWWHRLRLSVRALIALVMAIGVFLGWYVRTVQVQRDAVAAIKRAGGALRTTGNGATTIQISLTQTEGLGHRDGLRIAWVWIMSRMSST